jgi:hypothetical protein
LYCPLNSNKTEVEGRNKKSRCTKQSIITGLHTSSPSSNLKHANDSIEMRNLTTGYVLRKALLGDSVVAQTRTYTKLDSTV